MREDIDSIIKNLVKIKVEIIDKIEIKYFEFEIFLCGLYLVESC
jgi:hypothetical protein